MSREKGTGAAAHGQHPRPLSHRYAMPALPKEESKPSQALPRQLPRRGSFVRADQQMANSSPGVERLPPGRGKIAKPERGTTGERREPERVLSAARLFPQETSAADAVFLHDPTRENAMPGGPQTARHCSIISNFSAEYAQSTTTTTAASGGNREELLGQRPARRKCRPRHDADAGCRNPIAERIPIVFLRTAPLPPDAPAKRTAMPRRTGSPP